MVIRPLLLAALLAAVLAAPGARAATSETLYIETKQLMPGDGASVECARIVVRDGKIAEVGTEVKRPPWSRAIDASDLVVTPGFVLPMTRQFMPPPPPQPQQEGVRVEMKPDAKAADDVLTRDEDLRLMIEGGVTLMGVMPSGFDAGVPGLLAAVSTRGGPRSGAIVAAEPTLVINVATHAPFREALAKAVEQADDAARARAKAKSKAKAKSTEGDEGKPSNFEKAMTGKLPVLLLAPTPARLLAARDVLPLDDMKATILDGPDLWWETDVLKKAGVRVLTAPVLVRERGTRFPKNRAAHYEHAGIPYAFTLTDDVPEAAPVLRDAMLEMARTGCTREKALAAVTSEAAAVLGLRDDAGRVAKGCRADLLFWSGDPFDPASRLVRVMMSGDFIERLPAVKAP
jgi:imidazolonepropionase-like amidohydrolase